MMRRHYRRGITLIEALIAMVMIVIIALGGLSYQYFGAKHFRIAHGELTATRATQLVLEDWKGSGANAPANYDPSTLGLGFAKPIGGEDCDYIITVDGVKMYMTLAYNDVEVDTDSGITLRELDVTTQWRNDGGSAAPGASDPSIFMATYARRGQD
jgi:Tfp pilus assembly protein PilV